MNYQDSHILYKRSSKYNLDIIKLTHNDQLLVGYDSYVESVKGGTTAANKSDESLELVDIMGVHIFIPTKLFAIWAIKDDQPYSDIILSKGVDKFLQELR